MHDPWTWTKRGVECGWEWGAVWRGIKGGKLDNCNSIINKIYFKKFYFSSRNWTGSWIFVVFLNVWLQASKLMVCFSPDLWFWFIEVYHSLSSPGCKPYSYSQSTAPHQLLTPLPPPSMPQSLRPSKREQVSLYSEGKHCPSSAVRSYIRILCHYCLKNSEPPSLRVNCGSHLTDMSRAKMIG